MFSIVEVAETQFSPDVPAMPKPSSVVWISHRLAEPITQVQILQGRHLSNVEPSNGLCESDSYSGNAPFTSLAMVLS